MIQKRKLDFIVIGAQKAGTTTLFKLLRQHHDVYLPPEKEAPYFGYQDRESLGWEWYLNEFFCKADENKLWGSVTPYYMADGQIAFRIKEVLPDVKVIAILRDPYERAYSHYKMSVRRGDETSSYSEVIERLTNDDALEKSRHEFQSEINSYFSWSEYGRILDCYYKVFEREDILVLFTDDLEQNPEGVINKICQFLKISKFTPEGLGEKYHVGGSKQKTSVILNLKKLTWLRQSWRSVVPFRFRRRIMYWFDQWNTVRDESDKIDQHMIRDQRLRQIFDKDAHILAELLKAPVPWKVRE